MCLGEKVLREYKSVKYFPFENEAGAPYILTSNPLSYLEAWLDRELTSIKRDGKGKRKKIEKARYFTQLAIDFYNSARLAEMPSKGTLIYYSFINLVKVFLITKGHDLGKNIEHHGISLPPSNDLKLKLSGISNDGISIFHEFAKNIGKEIKNSDGVIVKFTDFLRNLPEVHEIGYALDLFKGTKRKFLPVDINILTNSSRKKLFYTLSYEKKFDKQMSTNKLTEKKPFRNKLDKIDSGDDKNRTCFKSKFIINYTYSSSKSWKICYPKIVNDINQLNIAPMITRQGYRYYLDLEPDNRFHRLVSVLGFAFYIGTVARYRPTLNEKILKGEWQSIINEAIISCPNQFFYLLVSHITKQVCAIPMAKID